MNAKKYKPVGLCIYCGSKKKLTDEHVIPLGLNGNIILPDASCLDCNKITSNFEGSVLKGDLKSLRAALSFKTRRPRDMPKTVPLWVTQNGRESVLQVPPAESLAVLPFPIFELPGFCVGREPKPGITICSFVNVHFGANPQQLLARYGAEKVGVVLRVDSLAFARMVAKIAYCTVVGELGYGALDQNYVLPAIVGSSDDLGTWVGAAEGPTQPMPQEIQHSVTYSIYEKANQRILGVGVKLFSNTAAPAYLVVLGRPAEGLKIKAN